MPNWTIWHHAQLRTLAGEGKSAKEIGLAIGKTKNACIGMCHRRGILLTAKGGHRVIHATPSPKKQPKERLAMEEATEVPKIMFAAPAPAYEPSVIHSKGTVTLYDRTSSQCPYILGPVSRNSIVCGQSVIEGSPYCQSHHTACHTDRALKQINLAA